MNEWIYKEVLCEIQSSMKTEVIMFFPDIIGNTIKIMKHPSN